MAYMNKAELIQHLKDRIQALEASKGGVSGEIVYDYGAGTTDREYWVDGWFFNGQHVKLPSTHRRVADCGHEVKFGILGCSCPDED